MVDKRRKNRLHKRLRVMYGTNIPSKVGFTTDVSESGLCIKSFIVYKPGEIILLEIELADGSLIRAEGRVHWARKVPPNMLRKVKHAGMGIKLINFTNGREEYLQLFHER
jgi:Tfp pilus assembly protein PilZ